MNSVQSNYPDNIRSGVKGQIINTVPSTVISRTVESEDGLEFGAAAAQGDGDKGVKAFGTGDTAIVGIAVRERSLDANTPNKFARYDTARLITKGVVLVEASVAVDAGDPVFVVPATGAFAKTSASSAVQIPGARWDTSAGASELAEVRLS